MEKKYVTPFMDVIEFRNEDVITTSGPVAVVDGGDDD